MSQVARSGPPIRYEERVPGGSVGPSPTIERAMILEVCTASAEDCITAARNGADRLELNAALELGGLTPSTAVQREARRRVETPLLIMIRPRCGGFCYSPVEFDVMLRDAEWALAEGADGIAFGFLHASGDIDEERTRRLVRLCGTREAVFHRAFDLVPDPTEALERLIDCGVKRVLTSGHRPTALEGADRIAELIARAANRIEILPGSGIRPDNVAELVARTGTMQVHASLTRTAFDASARHNPAVRFGAPGTEGDAGFRETDGASVAAMRAALDRLPERS